MLFRVDFKSGEAVHLQLISQVKAAIATGALRPGEPLPAVGTAAQELRVNRNHVAKAYAELEGLGIIEMAPGKGYCLKEQHRPIRKGILRTPEQDPAQWTMQASLRQRMAQLLPVVAATMFYLALVTVSAAALLRLGLVRGEWPTIFATVSLAGLLIPLRSGLKQVFEKIFFPKRQRAKPLLQKLRMGLWSNPSLDALLERIAESCEEFLSVCPKIIREHAEVLGLVNSFPALRTARSPVSAGNDLFMPMFSHDEVIAVLFLTSKGFARFDHDDWEFLTAVGEQFTLAASQLRAQSEKVESEYALEIQRGLLPREVPQAPGFSIAGAWQPAKDVGGDYYDVFRLNDDEMALIVADVSGKGAPAALLMANLQATAKAYAGSASSVAELCQKVNTAICASITAGKFITFFYAVLNTKRRALAYCNAGHNPPLVVSQNGDCQKLETGGTVLGLFADAEYIEASIQLQDGDRVVIFTDGVIEAADAHEREFGDDRLFTAMTASADASAGELRDSIMQAVTHFCQGDFADDATLLTVVVNAAASAAASTR